MFDFNMHTERKFPNLAKTIEPELNSVNYCMIRFGIQMLNEQRERERMKKKEVNENKCSAATQSRKYCFHFKLFKSFIFN